MKIKKFKNLWTMGLILFGAILGLFYFIKLVAPDFIIGIAETPNIIAFGNYVDSHLWAYYLYSTVIGLLGTYIYCCACCQVKRLDLIDCLIILGGIVFLDLIGIMFTQYYSTINLLILMLTPYLISIKRGLPLDKIFKSTLICIFIDIFAQILSVTIRDLTLMSSTINSATITILLIDTWIWRILLYLYFNNKKGG